MERYDVVVVGGSCAGAAAAYTLARGHRKVVVVDKAVFPRRKLCGGLLTRKSVALLKEIYSPVALEDIVLMRSSTLGVFHADLGKICKYSDSSERLFAIDRYDFDHYFLEKAASAGCRVVCGQAVRQADGGRVVLDNGDVLSGDFIIGADGPYSVVRKAVAPHTERADYAVGIEADVPYEHLKCFDDEGVYPQVYFGFIDAGYGWVFPKPSFVTVGLGGLMHANPPGSLKERFHIFLRHLFKCKEMIPKRLKGFPIPFHNFVKKPGKDRILLAGDAAGLVEPITGEGMYFAMLSGKLAAEAILMQKDPVDSYNEAVNRKIHPLFRQALWVRKAFYQRRLSLYAMHKLRTNAKYCKYYLELLSGATDYRGYVRRIFRDRNHYPSL